LAFVSLTLFGTRRFNNRRDPRSTGRAAARLSSSGWNYQRDDSGLVKEASPALRRREPLARVLDQPGPLAKRAAIEGKARSDSTRNKPRRGPCQCCL